MSEKTETLKDQVEECIRFAEQDADHQLGGYATPVPLSVQLLKKNG